MKTYCIHENPDVRKSVCSALAPDITSNQEVVQNAGNANVKDLSKCTTCRGVSFVLITYSNAEVVSRLQAHVVSIMCILPSSKTSWFSNQTSRCR